jgi:O-succinylbenzoate synthase
MAFVKITSFKTYRFHLPLRRPLAVGKRHLTTKSGYIIQLSAGDDQVAWGEVSPLTGLSQESLTQAEKDIAGLRDTVIQRHVPEGLEKLSGGFQEWLPEDIVPSVRFGFEMAVLNLIATRRGEPLCRLICETPQDAISVNGLLSGSPNEVMAKTAKLLERGYKAFKLKVGRRSVQEDADMTISLRQRIGNEASLRLDANQAWSTEEARAFSTAVAHCEIDYLEEPVRTLDQLQALVNAPEVTLPFALDESLQKLNLEGLSSFSGIKAVVLKPTLWGFEKTIQTARQATGLGMTPVISSAFESGIGIQALAQIAACVNANDVPAGLDTLDIFEEDLRSDPLPINRGELSRVALSHAGQSVKQHLLRRCHEKD